VTALKIPAGCIALGSVYPGASTLQDLAYVRRVERLNAERAVKATPAPEDTSAAGGVSVSEIRSSTRSSRRAKR
jgi:hypothetical protein